MNYFFLKRQIKSERLISLAHSDTILRKTDGKKFKDTFHFQNKVKLLKTEERNISDINMKTFFIIFRLIKHQFLAGRN